VRPRLRPRAAGPFPQLIDEAGVASCTRAQVGAWRDDARPDLCHVARWTGPIQRAGAAREV